MSRPRELVRMGARGALVAVSLYVLSALVAVLLLHGCAGKGSREPAARSAVQVIGDVIAPAYRLAMETCSARDDVLTAEAKSGKAELAEVERARAELGARCRALEEDFEAARAAHDHAVDLLEQGKFAEAEAMVQTLRARVQALAPQGGP